MTGSVLAVCCGLLLLADAALPSLCSVGQRSRIWGACIGQWILMRPETGVFD